MHWMASEVGSLCLVLLGLAFLPVAAASIDGPNIAPVDQSISSTPPNSNHIFRTLISALRQFPSSINHNGVSFLFASIPAGTQLYHGRGGRQRIDSGFEWLALEPEHAANFAAKVCFPDGAPSPPPAVPPATSRTLEPSIPRSDGSAKWWLSPDELEILRPGAERRAHPFSSKEEECTCPDESSTIPGLESSIAIPHPSSAYFRRPQQRLNQQHILQLPFQPERRNPPPRPPKHDFPRVCVLPGYLHTYSPISDLQLLYIDGQSAAKSSLGTLASQDDILLRNSSFRPGKHMFDDGIRAAGLCELAEREWDGRIDGFVRMEHGFEVILCDFRKVRLEHVVKRGDVMGRSRRDGGSILQFWQAVGEDRWWGIGRDRVRLWTKKWVSAFTVEGLDLWRKSVDGELPSLSEVTDDVAADLRRQLKDIVLERTKELADDRREGSSPDWQAVADLYVKRYATRLQYLMTLEDAVQMANATRDMYMVYHDGADHSLGSADNAIQRCTHAFIPAHLKDTPTVTQSLSQRAITTVALQICSTLNTVMRPPLSDDLKAQKEHLHQLMTYLRWPQWKYCNGNRGCNVDEVCLTAIWPWGDQEDHDWPKCWNATGLLQRMNGGNGSERGGGYWRMGEIKVD